MSGNAILCAAFLLGASVPLFPQSTAGRQSQLAAHGAKAAEYLKANRPDQAAREFAAILALDPENADAHTNLGVLMFFQGDYTKAAPELRSALRLRPDQPKIEALLGLCEKRLGQAASARKHLVQSFPRLQDEKLRVEAGMELAEIDFSSNRLEDAAATVAALRQLRPADPDVLYAAHRIYSDLADECMLTVAMTNPESARMRQLIANEMARRGNAEGAIAKYREAIKIDPHLPGVHFQFAEALSSAASMDDRAQAEKEYRAALAENPLDAKSEARLGALALARLDSKEALARYSRALQLEPGDADANLGMARVLLAGGQPQKAEPYLLRAVKAEPFDPATHMRLATLYRESHRAPEAARELAEFRRIKELKDRLGDVYRARLSDRPEP